ncbi:uncharacterized protein LOC131673164 isoform X1 [Phymastichus coffea]|uniref:uncharacterized protein LOC131673164 isoform X1 n=1 Tax=Phymastichus coffea TaxID=108790 RepID=UPI00273CA1CE|nr:uncharacterized protein LOC131673164 isoform X1 [Phymastichus coffea]
MASSSFGQQLVRLSAATCSPRGSRGMESIASAEFGRAAVRPYADIPGPRPIPLLGNTWRFIPFIGDFKICEVDKVSKRLHERYGDVVKIEGLLNRPDMVFVYDADEIERIFRQEEKMPHRPKMPSLDYYKHTLRKHVFSDSNPGVIAVHGEGWYNFRSKVQQVMLQPRTARMYIGSIEQASQAFLDRIERIKDEADEVPGDFLHEIHKWSLEAECSRTGSHRERGAGRATGLPGRGARARGDAAADRRGAELLQARRPARAQDPLLEAVPDARLAGLHRRPRHHPQHHVQVRAAGAREVAAGRGGHQRGPAARAVAAGARAADRGQPAARHGARLRPVPRRHRHDVQLGRVRAVPVGPESRQAASAARGGAQGVAAGREDRVGAHRPAQVSEGLREGDAEDVPGGDRQRALHADRHGDRRLPRAQRRARGVPALRHQQQRALLPTQRQLSARALAGRRRPRGAAARLRLAALRLRTAHVPRTQVRRARDPRRPQQDLPEVPSGVPPREAGVPHRADVHAEGTTEIEIRADVNGFEKRGLCGRLPLSRLHLFALTTHTLLHE